MDSSYEPIVGNSLSGLFDVFPIFTELEPYRDKNLNSWRETGSYNLIGATKSGFLFASKSARIWSILICGNPAFVKSCSEHRAFLTSAIGANKEPSPSWSFVSLYYMSLYVAMAWTRASNCAILYLDKGAIEQYCRGAAIKPGGGAYEVSSHVDAQSSVSTVHFKKCSTSHFHEAVWIAVHKRAEELAKVIEAQSKSRKPTAEEVMSLRALRLFQGNNFEDPLVWPSKLRNAINYRPGFSYRSVLKNNNLRTIARLGKTVLPDNEAIITFGERAKNSARSKDPAEVPNACIDLLIAQTLFMESIVGRTMTRLCDVQGFTCSASTQRTQFGRRHSGTRDVLKPL